MNDKYGHGSTIKEYELIYEKKVINGIVVLNPNLFPIHVGDNKNGIGGKLTNRKRYILIGA